MFGGWIYSTLPSAPPPIGFDADADKRYEAIEPDEKAARPGRPTVELFFALLDRVGSCCLLGVS